MSGILALHGAVGAPEDWDALESSLGQPLRKVPLWEAPAGLTLESWAAAFCATAAPGSVLLGYSMGARLALHALLHDPGRWRAAVLLSAHPGLAEEADRAARRAADAQWAEAARTMPWNGFLEKWNAQPVLGAEPVRESQRRLEPHRAAIAASFESWSLGRQRDLRRDLAGLDLPVLWITGARDGKFTALAAECAALMKCGRHAAIAGAGHRVHLEAPDKVAAEAAAFLAGAVRR